MLTRDRLDLRLLVIMYKLNGSVHRGFYNCNTDSMFHASKTQQLAKE